MANRARQKDRAAAFAVARCHSRSHRVRQGNSSVALCSIGTVRVLRNRFWKVKK
ncbi:hypothetical protein ACFL27_22545 [candidate division CSSED10-310 bacterium]|uniref:Uncharacterized protein n=1 Tax=candidate division CSSED10-310 bacterium TaxID=2855610 RepID=A0ABV6Z3F9_UNCC1